VWFQKISILPPQKGLELPEGWGVLQDRKKIDLSNLTGISRRVGSRKNPFRGGGMDTFWNYIPNVNF